MNSTGIDTPDAPASATLDAFAALPALRGLARLADLRPVVLIDTREQAPLTFTRLESQRGTLQSGDYSFAGGEDLFAIERKTIPDLVACCVGNGRDRFFRELHRLRGFRFARLIVIGTPDGIGTHNYRANVTPAAVMATLAVIEARFEVPVVFIPAAPEAALQIERWAFWFARELCVSANSLLRGTEDCGRRRPQHPPARPEIVPLRPRNARGRATEAAMPVRDR